MFNEVGEERTSQKKQCSLIDMATPLEKWLLQALLLFPTYSTTTPGKYSCDYISAWHYCNILMKAKSKAKGKARSLLTQSRRFILLHKLTWEARRQLLFWLRKRLHSFDHLCCLTTNAMSVCQNVLERTLYANPNFKMYLQTKKKKKVAFPQKIVSDSLRSDSGQGRSDSRRGRRGHPQCASGKRWTCLLPWLPEKKTSMRTSGHTIS